MYVRRKYTGKFVRDVDLLYGIINDNLFMQCDKGTCHLWDHGVDCETYLLVKENTHSVCILSTQQVVL